MYHKFLFWKRQSWYKNKNCQVVALVSMECYAYLSIFMQPRFQWKRVIMKQTTFLILRTTRIFSKLLGVSEISMKIKVRSHWTLFVILLTSGWSSPVIWKQRLFHENEIGQYLQNRNAVMLAKTISTRFKKSSYP